LTLHSYVAVLHRSSYQSNTTLLSSDPSVSTADSSTGFLKLFPSV